MQDLELCFLQGLPFEDVRIGLRAVGPKVSKRIRVLVSVSCKDFALCFRSVFGRIDRFLAHLHDPRTSLVEPGVGDLEEVNISKHLWTSLQVDGLSQRRPAQTFGQSARPTVV